MTAEDLEGLAAIAHACWCAKLLGEGWRLGPYNPPGRTHDSLVAFESLDPLDRQSAVDSVRALDLEGLLARAIEYDHGPAREFTLKEMVKDLEVVWADAPATPGIDSAADRGRIQSWNVDASTGRLSLIQVRWADGSLSEHFPSQRELRRV